MALPWLRQEMIMLRPTRYPGIEALPDGRKRIRLRAMDPRTGRMKEVDRVVEATVENALKLQAEWRAEVRRGDRAAADVPRLTDYATSWLRSRLPALKASTAATYADVLDAHVLPHLGEFFLDRLMDSDVREWQAKLAGKFAAATVNGALVMLRLVLADAVAEFRLAHDPTARIKRMPKRRRPDDDPNVLSAGELGRVMAVFRDTEPEHYPLALTLALTGIRYGEATALRWSDIDEAGAVIRIERAQWHGIVGETKTGNVRTVPLTAELAEVLRDRRRNARGGAGWVFANEDGGLLGPCALRFPLRRVLKRAGITKRVSVHGLRRTFNNLSRQVAGVIVTRAITGHVTEEMTEHYSHVDRAEKLRAADQVVALAGLRAPANDTTSPNAPARGGSGRGLN
jgi:integrase